MTAAVTRGHPIGKKGVKEVEAGRTSRTGGHCHRQGERPDDFSLKASRRKIALIVP